METKLVLQFQTIIYSDCNNENHRNFEHIIGSGEAFTQPIWEMCVPLSTFLHNFHDNDAKSLGKFYCKCTTCDKSL